MTKIVIIMDGGLIHSVVSDSGPVEAYVVDYDTEGVELDHPHLTKLSGDDCLLSPLEVEVHPDSVALVQKTWETI